MYSSRLCVYLFGGYGFHLLDGLWFTSSLIQRNIKISRNSKSSTVVQQKKNVKKAQMFQLSHPVHFEGKGIYLGEG